MVVILSSPVQEVRTVQYQSPFAGSVAVSDAASCADLRGSAWGLLRTCSLVLHLLGTLPCQALASDTRGPARMAINIQQHRARDLDQRLRGRRRQALANQRQRLRQDEAMIAGLRHGRRDLSHHLT